MWFNSIPNRLSYTPFQSICQAVAPKVPIAPLPTEPESFKSVPRWKLQNITCAHRCRLNRIVIQRHCDSCFIFIFQDLSKQLSESRTWAWVSPLYRYTKADSVACFELFTRGCSACEVDRGLRATMRHLQGGDQQNGTLDIQPQFWVVDKSTRRARNRYAKQLFIEQRRGIGLALKALEDTNYRL